MLVLYIVYVLETVVRRVLCMLRTLCQLFGLDCYCYCCGDWTCDQDWDKDWHQYCNCIAYGVLFIVRYM